MAAQQTATGHRSIAAEPIRLRCSALPLAFKCPGSVRQASIAINATNDAAELGTAAHEALAHLVETGSVDWGSVPALARKYGVNESELRPLLAAGAQLWKLVGDSFPGAITEVEAAYDGEGFVLTGHADIIGRSQNQARVGDWKSGRLDSDYREQLLGYAALALLEDHTLESASAGVLWLRDGDYEHYTMTRAQLPEWVERVQSGIVDWDGEYRPGSHCQYCHLNHECPAANALVRRDVAVIADRDLVGHLEDAETIHEMVQRDPGQVVAVLAKADMVASYAERVRAAIRAYVIEHGDIEGGGKRLTIQREERRRLDVLKTFPVLESQGFGDEEMAEVIEISAAKAEKVIARRAPRGKGAGMVREFRAQLDAAEAVTTEQITKLVTRRA